jgi:hypothetical protein
MSQELIQKNDDQTNASSVNITSSSSLDATLSELSKTMSKIRVVHGANDVYFENIDGKTVGKVRDQLATSFNIPKNADALVKGVKVEEDFILEAGMTIEFKREAGTKGFSVKFD